MDYEEGALAEVEMHDGSHLRLRKADRSYDPTNKSEALQMLTQTNVDKELLTGLIYINEKEPDFLSTLELCDTPLAHLKPEEVRPGEEALRKIPSQSSKRSSGR